MNKAKILASAALLAGLLCAGCNTNNRDMSGMGVSKWSYEGCNYLVFKRKGDYGNSVLLDPKSQPDSCGK